MVRSLLLLCACNSADRVDRFNRGASQDARSMDTASPSDTGPIQDAISHIDTSVGADAQVNVDANASNSDSGQLDTGLEPADTGGPGNASDAGSGNASDAGPGNASDAGPGNASDAGAQAAPICDYIGTRSEGWYHQNGTRICWVQCINNIAECRDIGTPSEGWYATQNAGCPSSGSLGLIEYTICGP